MDPPCGLPHGSVNLISNHRGFLGGHKSSFVVEGVRKSIFVTLVRELTFYVGDMVQLSAAFAGQAFPVSTRTARTARVTLRCSVAEVEKYFPAYRRNKAPVISFNGEEGIKLQMTRIKAFQEVENGTPPLLDYSDPEQFTPVKPVPPSVISWPGGDGRGKTMTGTKGSFTQADLKTYGPFPDFFKVCISSFSGKRTILTLPCYSDPAIRNAPTIRASTNLQGVQLLCTSSFPSRCTTVRSPLKVVSTSFIVQYCFWPPISFLHQPYKCVWRIMYELV